MRYARWLFAWILRGLFLVTTLPFLILVEVIGLIFTLLSKFCRTIQELCDDYMTYALSVAKFVGRETGKISPTKFPKKAGVK